MCQKPDRATGTMHQVSYTSANQLYSEWGKEKSAATEPVISQKLTCEWLQFKSLEKVGAIKLPFLPYMILIMLLLGTQRQCFVCYEFRA